MTPGSCAMNLLLYAHLGHWYVQLPFVVPSLVIMIYMARTNLRDRKRRRQKTDRAQGDKSRRRGPP